MKAYLIVVTSLAIVFYVKPAVACGESQYPGGCTKNFYYILKTIPWDCDKLKADSMHDIKINPWVALSKKECDKQKLLQQKLITQGIPKGFNRTYRVSNLTTESYADAVIEMQIVERFGQYLEKYPMRNLFDGNSKTFWAEGIPGSGIGIRWFIGSNVEPLTFEGIKIINGCAKDAETYKKNNRIKEIVMFSPNNVEEKVNVSDSLKLQTIRFKQPIQSFEISFAIQSVYPGKAFDDTCISEIHFITKEEGEWPPVPHTVIETHPERKSPHDMLEWDHYTYPSYDIYIDGKKSGFFEGEFLHFFISPSEWILATDMEGYYLEPISALKNRKEPIQVNRAYENLLKLTSPNAIPSVVGWFSNNLLCVMQRSDALPTVSFLLFEQKNYALELVDKKEIVVTTVNATLAENENAYVKSETVLRKFCPVKTSILQ